MNKITQNAYENAVIKNFAFLKSASNTQEVYLKAIPIGGGGFLIPISEKDVHDEHTIATLTEWRNANVDAYPTQFEATIESTRKWLIEQLLACPDRILFFVVDDCGKPLGHMGFNGCLNDSRTFELDNVARGTTDSPGIMSRALQSLLEWARKSIHIESFTLQVFASNKHAVSFYERNGFVATKKTPLVAEHFSKHISYRDAKKGETATEHFLLMSYKAKPFLGDNIILTAGPSITSRESSYAFDATTEGWNQNWSSYLNQFEQSFAKYVDTKYAIATSSCTGALQIALLSLGIGPKDEVIVPDQTWVATANAVRYTGATPVFADIELDTWNVDAESVEKLISHATKAIIAVHMYGHPARMHRILSVARRHKIYLVEDAAPAIGAEWQGQRCGSFGDFAAFSFQGAKLMVTGEGGMLVTSNQKLFEKARKIWDQGRNASDSRAFWIDEHGVKFKMSNLQAAVGLAQLERVDELIEMKRRIFEWYMEGLEQVPHIRLNKEVEGARSIYWMSSIVLDRTAPFERDALIKHLKEKNIDTRPVFPAISQYPIWATQQLPKPNADYIGNNGINLPSGVCLTKSQVQYTCRHIREFIDRKVRQIDC